MKPKYLLALLCTSVFYANTATAAAADVVRLSKGDQLVATSNAIVTADKKLPWITGKVVRISVKRMSVTIAHGEISNLSMPAMTMGFKATDSDTLDMLEVGDEIEFQADDDNGTLILVAVKEPSA